MSDLIVQMDLKQKLAETKNVIKEYYLNDTRPLCIAYSGGKDSTALIFIILDVLKELKKENKIYKTTHIINSNTLAELPPILKHLESSLETIQSEANEHSLNIKVHEVKPQIKHTLNVQLLGVGMPPPSMNFRWCTSKLKIQPIENEIKRLFSDERFISVVGSRRDESADRNKRIISQSKVNSHLKINDRFKYADTLYPIEYWNTKNVWEYLFQQSNKVIDVDFLWNLYSDASNKTAKECSFVGAGGKNIDEGNLGCGQSRFGCWQCYVVRDNDKSLDGLMKSGYNNIELYKEYRELYWKYTQKGWEHTRDVYSHRNHYREYFDDTKYDRLGMTKPKGITLKIRKYFFKKLLELNNRIEDNIINIDEIILIQQRWLYEGDLELTAFKEAKKAGFNIPNSLTKKILKERKLAKEFYKNYLQRGELKIHFSILTLKRYAIQHIVNIKTLDNRFFPTKKEEKQIRLSWTKMKCSKTKPHFPTIKELLNN